MAIRRRVHDGTELSNALQTLLTFSDNLVEGGAVVVAGTISNLDAARRQVKVYLVPSGSAAADANCIYNEYVPPGRTVSMPGGPWWGNSGAFVQAISDAAGSNVGVRITGFEEYQAG